MGFKALKCAFVLCVMCLACAIHAGEALDKFDRIHFQRLLHGEAERVDAIKTINVTRQDQTGFIWFGGLYGLARYDGHEIKVYEPNSSLPGALPGGDIWNIEFDRDGVMWVSTENGLARYNAATDDFSVFLTTGSTPGDIIGESVLALAVTADNRLLAGTNNGLFILDDKRQLITHYHKDAIDPEKRLPTNAVETVHVSTDGAIWLGTRYDGLVQLYLNPYRVKIFKQNSPAPRTLSHNNVTDINEDQYGNIWAATFGGGLNRLSAESGTIEHFTHNPDDPNSIGSNTLWKIHRDSFENLWVATDGGGLALYDPAHNNFRHLRHNPFDDTSLSSDAVRDIYEDKSGSLWVATYPIGTNYFHRASSKIANYSHNPSIPESLSHSTILTIKPSRRGHLWVGTENGLDAFDPNTRISRHLNPASQQSHPLNTKPVLAVHELENGDLWIGTWSGGLRYFEAKTESFTLMFSENQEHLAATAYIWDILEDSQGDIWLATETHGLLRYSPVDGTLTQFSRKHQQGSNAVHHLVWKLMEDHSGKIWAATDEGLSYYDPQTHRFHHFLPLANNPNSLTSKRAFTLLEDRDHNIWVGTLGGGISILNPGRTQFTNFNDHSGLPAKNIANLLEAPDGKIWAATDKGLFCIDPETLNFKQIRRDQGLVGDYFNRNASHATADGTLYFGSTKGISVLQMGDLPNVEQASDVTFTELLISNRPVVAGQPGSPITEAIHNVQALRLSHQQRSFALGFSALNYGAHGTTRYHYRLEGFDKEWHNTGHHYLANYTNIPPGKYLLKIRNTDQSGQWNENAAQMAITILPAPWASWWAKLLYLLSALSLGAAMLYFKSRQLELRKEKDLNTKLLKLDRMKDTFLANTSHELRTPINGIIGLAEALADDANHTLSQEQFTKLKMIASNGRRLSHLINDILDVSKLAGGNINLHITAVNLRAVSESVLTLLSPLAESKGLALRNHIPQEMLAVMADENRLQQILVNLLGNAIKYSDEGAIEISAHQDLINTAITISDSGIGIASEELDAIFNSFHQLQQGDDLHRGGTGLGLAITRELVELHGSAIEVSSEPGRGSRFTFQLPTGTRKFAAVKTPSQSPAPATSESGKISNIDTPILGPTLLNLNTHISQLTKHMHFDQTILIVDDDVINRMVLTSVLQLRDYTVIEASNGEEGLQKLKEHPEISLVILDVMMPNLSGYEVCKTLRKQYNLTELPVIFLTAKYIDKELLQGFACGANDFVFKPINREELLARVQVHLATARCARALTLLQTPGQKALP